MKRSILILSSIMLVIGTRAQPINKYPGTWEGKINPGIELRVVFHIILGDNGNLISTTDSPDQAAYGMKCDTTIIEGDEIRIEMRDLKAWYRGKLIDDSTISGNLSQMKDFPLTLHKGEHFAERKRPQTPIPPFPYKTEDIEYYSTDKKMHYGATISIPEGKGPFPAMVMITGSGAQNRDEEIMGHKTFAVIADYLTRKGYILLRVDDRGVGKTNGNIVSSTSADFAIDVSVGIDYLLTRSEVNKKKIGLIGHSEGGLIAPIVAVQRKDINFIILLAGPGVKIPDLMTEQNAAIIRSSGISEPAIAAYTSLYKKMIVKIAESPDSIMAVAGAQQLMTDWNAQTPPLLLKELGLEKATRRDGLVTELVSTTYSPWFRYFVEFDPGPWLEKLHCKVLALNGDKDIQVISSQNLQGIRSSLAKSKSKNYDVIEMKGLNHLFQDCKKCTLEEYGELEESFSPDALKLIGDWLDKNVK